jgi:ribosomal protein L24E
MNTYSQHAGAPARCAYCTKPLPIVNGELQIWRDSSGQFFCNEFCADDAEEARFHSYRKAYRKASELLAPSQGG